MALRLRPLRDDELGAFREHGTERYARDMVENAGLTPEQARKKAENDWELSFPGGRVAPDNYLFAIEDGDTGEHVGDLWFAKRTNDFEGTTAFLYSIEIAEVFRGRGFGRQAMLLLENEVRARGLDRIALNVFGGNEVARALYRSLGYDETAVSMRKQL